MTKIIALAITFCLSSTLLFAQPLSCYWQQYVDYEMFIDFNVRKHQFDGTQTLAYTNNSPDTLHRVFYHLYFNAFQPKSAMHIRNLWLPDPDNRVEGKFAKLSKQEIGYHKIETLTQDGTPLTYKVIGTILEAKLAKPILPGQTSEFKMEFNSQVPVQIRRSGRNNSEEIDYSMTQWYPKMCAYDVEGWHADPYIGREFYGEFGKFDVKIKIDADYILGATGYLQNPNEIGYGYLETGNDKVKHKGTHTWHFKADRVHDFAWAADPEYLHNKLKVPNGPQLHFIYKNDTAYTNWQKAKPLLVQFFRIMSNIFGKYPYKQFTFIQGGDGGMEYPMLTLINTNGSFDGLMSVCVHEAIHNWYYGILATNEGKYPFMDEGFTHFCTAYMLNILLEQGKSNPQQDSYAAYLYLHKNGLEEPMLTRADWFSTNRNYGIQSYPGGAVMLKQLSYVIGEPAFFNAMRRYFEEWKFKHPTPKDFARIAEKESGMILDWYFNQFLVTLHEIDYKIDTLKKDGKNTNVQISRVEPFVMPLDIYVVDKDTTFHVYNIPLEIMRGAKEKPAYSNNKITYTIAESWRWVDTTYTLRVPLKKEDILAIYIDPTGRLADVDRSNNSWENKGKLEE